MMTKGGVVVELLEKRAPKAELHAPGFRLKDGKKVPNVIGNDHVRALFPDGSVQVVARANLKEVK
jgi:hypothetical protein